MTVKASEMAESLGVRMDAEFHMAKAVLIQILGELRHDTEPSIDEFMEGVDLILDQPKLARAAVESYRKQ